jgi:hypothetical protein
VESDALDDAEVPGEVVSVADVPAEVVSVGEVLALGDVPGEVVSVGDVLSLGEVESLGVPTICAAVRTTDDAGGDAQSWLAVVAAAVVAALTANPVKIIPVPKNAIPAIAFSAAGFRSSALTGCKLASLSRSKGQLSLAFATVLMLCAAMPDVELCTPKVHDRFAMGTPADCCRHY